MDSGYSLAMADFKQPPSSPLVIFFVGFSRSQCILRPNIILFLRNPPKKERN